MKKESLDGFDFQNTFFELTGDNKKILKKWLGNRYTRAAFPDEFNMRLSKAKVSKITEKIISTKVSHIFFEVEDEELSEDEKIINNYVLLIFFQIQKLKSLDFVLSEDVCIVLHKVLIHL